ncbi:hypothetical protein BD779DRAFT_542299 [Infundibulicybe gibba]|nr:hypothetical protein BD779DRAFT_542299 [Infundibulicybe gibba]
MFHQLLLSLVGTYLWSAGLTCARQNISIDDPSPSISYTPIASWGKTAPTSLDEGGSHMLTTDPGATATFSFTGVRVYFMSPLWPYTVTTALTLDNGPIILLNLTDPNQPATDGGPETAQSRVVWGSDELENKQHKFVVSVGQGQQFAIVDTLMSVSLRHNFSHFTDICLLFSPDTLLFLDTLRSTTKPHSHQPLHPLSMDLPILRPVLAIKHQSFPSPLGVVWASSPSSLSVFCFGSAVLAVIRIPKLKPKS